MAGRASRDTTIAGGTLIDYVAQRLRNPPIVRRYDARSFGEHCAGVPSIAAIPCLRNLEEWRVTDV